MAALLPSSLGGARIVGWIDVLELDGAVPIQHDRGFALREVYAKWFMLAGMSAKPPGNRVLSIEASPMPKVRAPLTTTRFSSVGCEWAGIA